MLTRKEFKMRTLPLSIVIVLVSSILAIHCPAAEREPGKQADEILKASGIRAGLCVHLGAGDGKLTAALGRKLGGGEATFIVQGLAADAEAVKKARAHIQAQGLYGPVSVVRSDFKPLPYAENLVNLAVAEDLPALLGKGLDLNEVFRVIVPNGVLCAGGKVDAGKLTAAGFKDVRAAGSWTAALKPRPKEMDDWPSYRYGPDRNRVSQDLLAGCPATRLRWRAGFSPLGVMVSAGGRLFHPRGVANYGWSWTRGSLIARDAYNGLLLWERPLEGALKPPGWRFRALAATADRVYVSLGKSAVLAALDGATGKVVRTYEEAGRVGGFLCHDGKLYVNRMAIDADTGKVLWKDSPAGVWLIADGRGFSLTWAGRRDPNPPKLGCLDLATGQMLWQKQLEHQVWRQVGWATSGFHYGGVLVLLHRGPQRQSKPWLAAYSPKDGRPLWEYKPENMVGSGHCPVGGPSHVFGAQGLIWAQVVLRKPGAAKAGIAWVGLDPASGEVRTLHDNTRTMCRCSRTIANERFVLGGTYDFFQFKTGKYDSPIFGRIGCGGSGTVIVANGLVYTPPHGCTCRNFMPVGFHAYAPGEEAPEETPSRLEKGSAAGAVATQPAAAKDGDWPTHRHDPARSGATPVALPPDLKQLWESPAGNRLTPPTAAEGKVFVASVDEHRLCALDAATGELRWSYTAGAPVDSPPTIHSGLAVFGCRDGWVYCLRASDGELAWRFRAAPMEEQIVVDGHLESPWPVHGSVLVLGDAAYFAAGRHSALDGGARLYKVKLESGALAWEKDLQRHPGRRAKYSAVNKRVALLSSDGKTIFMEGRRWGFDPTDGAVGRRTAVGRFVTFGQRGFLGGGARPRNFWSDGRVTARLLVSGREVSCAIYPQYAPKDHRRHERRAVGMGLYTLCAKNNEKEVWTTRAGVQTGAMVLADGTVYVAGRIDPEIPEIKKMAAHRKLRYEVPKFVSELPEERIHPKDARLLAFSAADGKILGEVKLPAPPVFDGLAAANGKLYLSCLDGKVRCLGRK